jgi:hypothetical protein
MCSWGCKELMEVAGAVHVGACRSAMHIPATLAMRSGIRRLLSGVARGRGEAAQTRSARDLQRVTLDGAHQLALALHSERLARRGSWSTSRRSAGLRRVASKPSCTSCARYWAEGGPVGGAERRGDRQPHASLHAGERSTGGLRRAQAEEGLEIHAAVDTLGHLLALCTAHGRMSTEPRSTRLVLRYRRSRARTSRSHTWIKATRASSLR